MQHEPKPDSAGNPDINDDTLRLALEVAQLAFWDHDFKNNRVYRSPEWSEMLGYTPAEVGSDPKFWLDRIHSEDRAMVDEGIRRHHNGQDSGMRLEHRIRTKNGQWKWVQNWGRIVERDENGAALRALGFHLDFTERKHAEAAMARADKLSTIGTLAGGIAHDFNNLLTVIMGNLQLAREADDAGSRDQFLKNAERATNRSQELTERLLTFARGGTPTLEPVDLEHVLIEARDLVLSGSSVRLQIECEPGLPAVAGCPGLLVQVFQNLLLNAAQAMPDGGIITATFARRRMHNPLGDLPEVGDYIEVVVSDQGPGIPQEIADKVFDPFFTTKTEGKGLGLAMAHSIVSDHKGQLDILNVDAVDDVNDICEGASLRVLLPVATAEIAHPGPAELKAAARNNARVLVVDDDEMVRELAATVIGNLGFEAVEADDGAKGVELYVAAIDDDKPFSAVLMDLTIPGGMGGKEAVSLILKRDPNARVVVTSGYSEDPVMAQYRDFGFRACLAKPYQLHEVRTVLATAMNDEGETTG